MIDPGQRLKLNFRNGQHMSSINTVGKSRIKNDLKVDTFSATQHVKHLDKISIHLPILQHLSRS